jgi:hypothetical protein
MSDDKDFVFVALTLSETIHLMALAAVYAPDDAVIASARAELASAADEYSEDNPDEAQNVARQILARNLFDKVDE